MKPQTIEVGKQVNGVVRVRATFDAQDMASVFRAVNRMLAYTYEVDSKSDDDIPALLAEKIGADRLEEARGQAVAPILAPFVVDALDFETMLDPTIVDAPMPLAGTSYSFSMDVVRKPEYELSGYDPVTIVLPKARFDSEEVTGLMAAIADEYAEYAPVSSDGVVQPGDRVMVDMNTYDDFGAVPSLCGRGITVKVGEGWLAPEFDENLIGLSVGAKKRFSIQALTEASADENDAEALYVTIDLRGIERPEDIDINDEWVASHIDGANTVAEFEQLVQSTMIQGGAQPQSEELLLARVAEALAQRLDISISDSLYQHTVNSMLAQMDQQSLSEGVPFDEYLGKLGLSMDTLGDYLMSRARSQIEQGFALDAYYRHLDLQIEDSDIDHAAMRMANTDRWEAVDSLKSQFEMAGKSYVLREMARRLKANTVALENARIVYE